MSALRPRTSTAGGDTLAARAWLPIPASSPHSANPEDELRRLLLELINYQKALLQNEWAPLPLDETFSPRFDVWNGGRGSPSSRLRALSHRFDILGAPAKILRRLPSRRGTMLVIYAQPVARKRVLTLGIGL